MSLTRWLSLLVLLAVVATACSADSTRDASVLPAGEVVSQVDEVGTVFSGSSQSFPNLNVEPVAAPLILPAGLLSVGEGLSITENSPVVGAVEIRLVLPESPSDDAVPGALRVLDDGSTQFVAGLWDPNSNQVIVQACLLYTSPSPRD